MKSKITQLSVVLSLLLIPMVEVFAEPVTFEISATVYNIYDPGNAFQNTVALGDKITGTYTIDIAVPDMEPDPQYGHYVFDPISPQLGFDLFVNNNSLKSDPYTTSHIYEADTINSSEDHFSLFSHGNMPLSNGSSVDDIFIDLFDPTGLALTSDALSAQAPNVAAFDYHDIHVSGNAWDGNFYNLEAKIYFIKAVPKQCQPSSSNLVTFNLTSTVREIYDYDNVLGGAIQVGDSIQGAYTFDTNTPDSDPTPEYGLYQHNPGSGNYGFNITVANTTLKTDTSTDMFNIVIGDASGTITWDMYAADNFGAQQPFINNTVVDNIGIYLDDPSGNMVSSTNLTNQPPALTGTGYKDLHFGGRSIANPSASPFTIVATLTSIGTICDQPQDPIVVSPSSGVFDPMQHFDAAIVMDAGLSPLVNMQATNNGIDITPMLSSCFPGAPNSQNRQTFICPNFSDLLLPGFNSLFFTFQLGDGSTLYHTVDWQLLRN
jgi:hypothetical protein